MRVYFISIPEVSTGLKRTYNKKLEVYSGVLPEADVDGRRKVQADSIYTFTRGAWVRKDTNQVVNRLIFGKEVKVYNTIPDFARMGTNTMYSSLELAKTAKLLLIQRMAKTYEEALKDLQALFDRNVPNVDNHLEKIREKNPEYFI